MRRFILSGLGIHAGVTGILASGIEWQPGGLCSVYWERRGIRADYPGIEVFRRDNENATDRMLWIDHEHLPKNTILDTKQDDDRAWLN